MTRVGESVTAARPLRGAYDSCRLSSVHCSRNRVTLGLASFGMLLVFLEVLRLVLCRFSAGSGVLLLGNSDNLTISLL
jgi:hypothetical protein